MDCITPPFEIARWIAAYLSKSLGSDEQMLLDRWRKASPAHEELFQKLCSEQRLLHYAEQRSWFDETEGWQRLQQKLQLQQYPLQDQLQKMQDSQQLQTESQQLQQQESQQYALHRQRFQRRKRLLSRVSNVAAALLLPLLWSALTLSTPSPSPTSTSGQSVAHATITPGSSKALLTLEDGSTVALSATTDTLLTQATSTTLRMDSAQLTYQHAALISEVSSAASANASTSTQPVAWNSIQTPQGGEYRLTLSDGTRVYLNAMSTLRFPVEFGSEQRTVELSGEALFEVSHSGKPFIVKTHEVEVEVMGTVFNLSAYPDESTHTTLVSGQVKVSAPGAGSCLLAPSQQASFAPGEGQLRVMQVDTDCFTTWTKGKILFKDVRLDEMMKQLCRWYDMEVSFADPSLKALRFGCHLNRYHDIAPFLRLLEQTGKVCVTTEGHHLTIAPPSSSPKYLSN